VDKSTAIVPAGRGSEGEDAMCWDRGARKGSDSEPHAQKPQVTELTVGGGGARGTLTSSRACNARVGSCYLLRLVGGNGVVIGAHPQTEVRTEGKAMLGTEGKAMLGTPRHAPGAAAPSYPCPPPLLRDHTSCDFTMEGGQRNFES